MPEIPLGAAILGSSLLSAGSSIFGASAASGAQTAAAGQANATQLQMFKDALDRSDTLLGKYNDQSLGLLDKYNNQSLGLLDKATGTLNPFIKQGNDALSPLKALTTPGGDMTNVLEQTPGYQFSFTQGEKGVTNQATSSGLSGNALRAGGQFAEGLAQNTWSTVVDKLLSQFSTGAGAAGTLGSLFTNVGNTSLGAATSVGNTGLSAATSTGNTGLYTAGNVGKAIGDNLTGAGNARAGADIATANAVGGVGNNITQALLLNSLTGGKLFGKTGNGGAWGDNNYPGNSGFNNIESETP